MSDERKPIRVLLADDHTVLREGTRELLVRQPDIEVVGEAGDGFDAIELTGRLQPDVVLMDVAMPTLNGVEATRRIKEMWPGVAVLVLSAFDEDEYVFTLLEAGAAGYLLKDVPGRRLIEAIRAVHAGEAVLHPAIQKKVLERFSRPAKRPDERTPDHLSERELEVLRYAGQGLSNKEIAAHLNLSVRTVEVHLSNIFGKLGVASRTEAVIEGLRRGLIKVDGEGIGNRG